MNKFKDSVYREVTVPTKKEVTAVAEVLNEENEKLTARIKVLESEVKGLKKVEAWHYKAWKNIKWWYGMNAQDEVNRALKHAGCIILVTYAVYKLGMEFAPALMGPLSNIVGRALTALLPW